ncbi:hypothetical protein [Micromonospora sonneratiae]|uniref:Integral membrane protein n=1 Tax=Micromonospora sonneratiae TaxID=1184706 RepID=A0ABW3YFD2_9ACTN
MTSAAAAGTPVDGVLATVGIVLSLVLAVWSLVASVRDRAPDRSHLIGLAVVELALLALAGTALIAIVGGDRPDEAGTFAGYLVTLVCLPPLAAVLARMEPTRWGSAIIGVICLVNPVLIVRLQQTWEVVGG